jgi:hypothetical protein
MRAGRLVIVLLLAGACGETERVQVELVDGDGSCSRDDPIDSVDRVQVDLRTPELQRSPCSLAEIATLQDLQAALAGVSFGDLEEGDYSLLVLGFDSSQGCAQDDVIACGRATFHLPGDPPRVSMICYEGSSPPAAFSACVAQRDP